MKWFKMPWWRKIIRGFGIFGFAELGLQSFKGNDAGLSASGYLAVIIVLICLAALDLAFEFFFDKKLKEQIIKNKGS